MRYKDDFGNISGADEITCPYCGNEYSDSWESMPNKNEGNEIAWDEECVECGKKFRVKFDVFNQDKGFDCDKICKRHTFAWDGKNRYLEHDLKYSISETSNVYKCSKCGEIKFVYTKENGTEYTKKELFSWKKKRDKEQFAKNHPELGKSESKKTVEIRYHDTSIIISTNEPEGNEGIFKSINNLLKSKGFKILINESYSKDGQFKSLQRWNRDLNRDWLWCQAEFSKSKIEYEFFQEKYSGGDSNGGRHDFNKYELMDTKMKTEFRSVRRLIEKNVRKICSVIDEPVQIIDSHGYVSRPKLVDPKFPGRVVSENSTKDFSGTYGEGISKDKETIHNGDFLGAYDDHGRLVVGWLYNRGGTYKYMVHNDKNISMFSSSQCFKVNKDTPARVLPENSLRKLKMLLSEKIKERDFLRCDKIYREIKKLEESE